MDLVSLIASCRIRADDNASPPLWSDDEWQLYLSEAERETCTRAKLIQTNEGRGTEISIEPGVTRYPLDPILLDVLSVEDAARPGVAIDGWDITETHLVLNRSPIAATELRLTVVRLPLAALMPESGPEIRAVHHYAMCDWALRCAYLKPDAETFNPQAAARHEDIFERAFGARPDANVQRKHRRKSPRVVRPITF